MADSTSRGAARAATLAALPVAILAGVLAFKLLSGAQRDGAGPDGTQRPGLQATAPVTMSAGPLTPREAGVCRDLLAQLPDRLRDLPRRPVATGGEQNAAYGDPAVTVACGAAPVPGDVTGNLWDLNGICWYAERRGDATIWTTVEREVPVAVTVPRRYDPPGAWVIDFSAPVLAAVPGGPRRCQ